MNRKFTNSINWVLDQLVPPILRDSKLFMGLLFYPLFKGKTKYFFQFKSELPYMTETRYKAYYKFLDDVHIKRKTALNRKSIDLIMKNLKGDKILDIACGKGFLINKIYKEHTHEAYGVDIALSQNQLSVNGPYYKLGNIENIPFGDKFFDTVLSTHTLEHVINISKSITELRRVAKKRIIVIVPKQREYAYTFDLHVRFFPYKHKILNLFRKRNAICKLVGNDWFYMEELS